MTTNQKQDELTELLGKPICVLTTNSSKTDRHYEEAGSVGEEMALHQEKMRAANDGWDD